MVGGGEMEISCQDLDSEDVVDKPIKGRRLKKQQKPSVGYERTVKEKMLKESSEAKETIPEKRKNTNDLVKPGEEAMLATKAIIKESGFRCGEEGCGAKFNKRSLLEGHGRSKHGKAKLSCSEPGCSKRFIYNSDLCWHKKFIHLGNKTHSCLEPDCNMQFTKLESLKGHGRKVHQEPKLKCQEQDCGLEFCSWRSLQHHINSIHKKILPFKCEEEGCDRKFARKFKLSDHGRAQHNHPKLRCQIKACDRQFISNSGLYKHREEHK